MDFDFIMETKYSHWQLKRDFGNEWDHFWVPRLIAYAKRNPPKNSTLFEEIVDMSMSEMTMGNGWV